MAFLTGYVLAYHAMSLSRERRARARSHFLFFEALGPVVEMLGYAVLVLGFFGETLLLSRHPRVRDRAILVGPRSWNSSDTGRSSRSRLRRHVPDQEEAGALGAPCPGSGSDPASNPERTRRPPDFPDRFLDARPRNVGTRPQR